jgi:translation elongation factor EF-Ts
MHQLFTSRVRSIIIAMTAVLLLLFCLNNFLWNLPVVDFRPFKVGTNLYEKKAAEEAAASSVKITAWKLQNKQTGEIVELPTETYMKELAKYPKTDWTVVEQIKTKPAIPATKVSEFSVVDGEGTEVGEDILSDSGHVFLIVAYELKGEAKTEEMMVPDTTWSTDTVRINPDSVILVKSISNVGTKKVTREVYVWEQDYVTDYQKKVNPLMEDVMKQGAKVYAIAGGAGVEMTNSFKEAVGAQYDWYEADDVLLKTIIRSNPGVVHLKAGKVLEMWHIRHLPSKLTLN